MERPLSLLENHGHEIVLKGHGFSRAKSATGLTRALAPEGSFGPFVQTRTFATSIERSFIT